MILSISSPFILVLRMPHDTNTLSVRRIAQRKDLVGAIFGLVARQTYCTERPPPDTPYSHSH